MRCGRPRHLPLAMAALVLFLAAQASAVLADTADDQFAVGAGHYAAGRWKMAAEEFAAFQKGYPKHPRVAEAFFYLGEARLALGEAASAEEAFRSYLARKPDGPLARQARFRTGEAAYLAGNPAIAKSELERFQSDYADDPLNAYVLAYLGELALQRNDRDEARRHYEACLKRFPEGPMQDDCRLGLARVAERAEQTETAARLYAALGAKTNSRMAPAAQLQLGVLYYRLGKYDDAIAAFRDLKQRWPDAGERTQAQLGEGWALFRQEKYAEALPLFTALADDAEAGPLARYWLGMTLKAQGQFRKAAEVLAGLAKLSPQSPLAPAAQFHAGQSYLRAGDTAAATALFDLVLANDKAESQWRQESLRAKIQAALAENHPAAVEPLAAAFARQFPQSELLDDIRRLHARALLLQSKYAAAAEILEPLVAKPAAKVTNETRYLLGLSYEGLQRYDRGLEAIAPIVEHADPATRDDALLLQGSLLMALKRPTDALAPLESVARQATGDVQQRALGQVAICLAQLGKFPEARDRYREFTASQPVESVQLAVASQLGEIALKANQVDWAGEVFGRLAEGKSAAARSAGLRGIAWAHFRAGRWNDALSAFETVLKQSPNGDATAEAQLARGQCFEKLEQLDAAIGCYDTVLDKHAKSRHAATAQLAGARLRAKLKQYDAATALFEQWLAQNRADAHRDAALYDAAWAYSDAGKPLESNRMLQLLREDHPQSRYWADATYRLAERAMEANDAAKAERLLNELVARGCQPELDEHARFLRGRAAMAQQQWAAAVQRFEEVTAKHPKSSLRPAVEFWIAEALYRQQKYDEAEKRLDELLDKPLQGKPAWEPTARLRQAQCRAQRRQWDEAYRLAEQIATRCPGFEQQYEVDYLLGRCLADRADFQAARDAYQRVIRSPQGAKTETAAMAQWMIGETYFHQKDYPTAVREYLRVEILYAWPQWQAAALMQAGKCSEMLNQPGEAADLYERLAKNFGSSSLAEEAASRARAVRALPGGRAGGTSKASASSLRSAGSRGPDLISPVAPSPLDKITN